MLISWPSFSVGCLSRVSRSKCGDYLKRSGLASCIACSVRCLSGKDQKDFGWGQPTLQPFADEKGAVRVPLHRKLNGAGCQLPLVIGLVEVPLRVCYQSFRSKSPFLETADPYRLVSAAGPEIRAR